MGGPLVIVMPYYENPGMLSYHYYEWACWLPSLGNHFQFIIVDDGSPEHPAGNVPRPDDLNIQIYRVLEDRPWHQHGARNLGAYVAPDDCWMLLTDMDHMLVSYSALALLAILETLDQRKAYMLSRIEADTLLPTLGKDGKPKPHPNSFVMTRDLYWRIGGYDEDFCGIYGTDALFRSRLPLGPTLDIPLIRYWRDLVPDASTNGLPRKEGRDPRAKEKVMRAKQREGRQGQITVLNFPWERVV